VRVLGIETSTRRGSVALLEGGRTLCALHHERLNAHAETLLPLVERLLAETGSARSSLDRLAVGVGPGSFTGLRVGIALAQGMALGLDRPLVGIGSLRAIARGAPEDDSRVRVVGLDARRDELFVAAYAADGREVLAPAALGRDVVAARVAEALGGAAAVGLGELSRELGPAVDPLTREDLDLPHARWVALLGADADPSAALAEPNYVRGPGATLPNLPPSPLGPPQP
jgi:tRNA threonylcarbamoyladenosine biosynthesis protein TsaB